MGSNSIMISFKEAEKLIINKDCVYIPALNIKNAKKLFDKNPTQSFYYKKEAPMSLKDISF